MATKEKLTSPEVENQEVETQESVENKDIVEIQWEEIEDVFGLRRDLMELEQYLSQAFLNFEKTRTAVMNRIIAAEGRMYNSAEELKILKGIEPNEPYELKMPTSEGDKAYFVKRQ